MVSVHCTGSAVLRYVPLVVDGEKGGGLLPALHCVESAVWNDFALQ